MILKKASELRKGDFVMLPTIGWIRGEIERIAHLRGINRTTLMLKSGRICSISSDDMLVVYSDLERAIHEL